MKNSPLTKQKRRWFWQQAVLEKPKKNLLVGKHNQPIPCRARLVVCKAVHPTGCAALFFTYYLLPIKRKRYETVVFSSRATRLR